MERLQMTSIYTSSSSGEEKNDKSSIQTETCSESPRRIYIQFFLFCISILCSISSYSGLIDLQSSINISDALGNRSLMLMSVSTVICCLFLAPVVIAACGAKNALLFSQLCYIVYVVSNFYPAPYILLPGGVFLGIAEGFLYAPCLMYCTYFGRKLAGIGSHNVKDSINKFVGYFWAIYQMNEIFGNSISTVILNVGKTASNNTMDVHHHDGALIVSTFNASTASPLVTGGHNLTTPSVGIAPTSVSSHISQNYTTHDYSMCGVNDCYNEQEYETMHGSYVPMSKAAVYTMLGVYTFLAVIAVPIMWNTPSLPGRSKKFTKTGADRESIPQVGLGMLGGGIVNVIVSFIYGAVSGSDLFRNLFLVICIFFDASLYVFCLLWKPTEDNYYMGLIACVIFGFTDGVWSPLLDGKYAKYFSKNEEVAYSVNNLWNCVGFTMMYGWTTLLCVRQKIYIQLAALCLGVLCLCV